MVAFSLRRDSMVDFVAQPTSKTRIGINAKPALTKVLTLRPPSYSATPWRIRWSFGTGRRGYFLNLANLSAVAGPAR